MEVGTLCGNYVTDAMFCCLSNDNAATHSISLRFSNGNEVTDTIYVASVMVKVNITRRFSRLALSLKAPSVLPQPCLLRTRNTFCSH